MKLITRAMTSLAVGLAILSNAPSAVADAYPERNIRWVVPFSAGGPTDSLSRMLAKNMEQQFRGISVVIDNRPGAAAIIGTQIVHGATPDGYTIGAMSDNISTNQLLLPKVPYKYSDFEYVTGLIRMPLVLALRSDLPPNNLKEALEYFKVNGSKLSYSTWGQGGSAHLAMERLQDIIKSNAIHVPYAGSAPAINALLAKQIDFVLLDQYSILPHVKSGAIKVVAVTTKARSPLLPQVPTVSEEIANFDAITWTGLAMPKNTPADVVRHMAESVEKILRRPDVEKDLTERGMTIWPTSAAELRSQVDLDFANAKGIIEKRGIKLE